MVDFDQTIYSSRSTFRVILIKRKFSMFKIKFTPNEDHRNVHLNYIGVCRPIKKRVVAC